MDLFAGFDKGKCISCGECFHLCPVLELPLEEAKAEVERLEKGQPTKKVVRKCTSCFSCNVFCKQGANPAQRILDIWHEMNLEKGMPERARYFTPANPVNFRTYIMDRMPEDEKALVKSWGDTSPAETILYPGCNWITQPYLSQTSLLDGVDIRGSLNVCCGEVYYRSGQYEMVEYAARQHKYWKEKIGFKKMIIPCSAGCNMFRNVLPKFADHYDFEVVHMLPWLLGRLEAGEFEIVKKLDLTVTIQDSCYGKILGDDSQGAARKLLEHMGCKVVESEYSKEKGLCCGIGGGFSHSSGYHPMDITTSTLRTMYNAKKTGAKTLAVYCAGCLQMITSGKLVWPFGMDVVHVFQLLQEAIGENPKRKATGRAFTAFRGTLIHQFPKLLSFKRFFQDEFTGK